MGLVNDCAPFWVRKVEHVPRKQQVRAISQSLLVLSWLEMMIGAASYIHSTSSHTVCWWVSVVTMIVAALGLNMNNRSIMLMTLLGSVVSVICSVVALYDEVAACCRISALKGCYNGATAEGTGAIHSITIAKSCNTGAQCTCADTSSFCYDFSLTGGGNDCSAIFVNYSNYLWCSSIVLVAIVGASLSLCSVMLLSATSNKNEDDLITPEHSPGKGGSDFAFR